MRKFRKLKLLLRIIERVKVKVRPDLEKVARHQVIQHRKQLASKVVEIRAILSSKTDVRRICLEDISVGEFRRCFEKPRIPVLLREPSWEKPYSIPHSSPALVRLIWFFKLFNNEYFECGEDSQGYSIEINLKNFLIYSRRCKDRYPLYIFDSSVPHWKGKTSKQLIVKALFDPPKFFKEDCMACLGKEHRPPWKWLLIGPKYSGTALHVDPLGTSAWNRLLFGEKIWILFPPETPAELLNLNQTGGNCEEPSDWITTMYPRTHCDSWPQQFKPLVVFQQPGDVMFVPSGWWHLVLNVKPSVAVTQNFVSKENFPVVWEKTCKKKPDLAVMWSKALLKQNPAFLAPYPSGSYINIS